MIEGAAAKLVDCLVEKNNMMATGSKANNSRGHGEGTDTADVSGPSDLGEEYGADEAFHVERAPVSAQNSADLLVPEPSFFSATTGIQPAFGAQASP